jgi:hypothetical protein
MIFVSPAMTGDFSFRDTVILSSASLNSSLRTHKGIIIVRKYIKRSLAFHKK